MSGKGRAKVALVTGATGIVGRHVVMHLQKLNDWEVYGTTRKDTLKYEEMDDLGPNVHALKLENLADKESCRKALNVKGVTHLFHCAYATAEDPYEDAKTNLDMLKSIVEVVEEITGDTLQLVYVQTGAKWYGKHQAQYPSNIPATDDVQFVSKLASR